MSSDNFTLEQCQALLKHAELEGRDTAVAYWQSRINQGKYKNA